MNQKAYDMKAKVHRKLAVLKRRGVIADFRFMGIHWVLIYFTIPGTAKMMPVDKILKRFKDDAAIKRYAEL